MPEDSLLPVPNRGGRPPKEIRKTRNPVPEVDFDPARDPADQVLPASDLLQSNDLGWKIADVRGVNRTLGIYDKLPMLCKGEHCFWADQCPTAQTNPPFMFEGTRCPIETLELYRNFVRYIRELEVHPDDHVDLQTIADLVRIDLQLSHMDKRLQIQGLEVDHVAAVAQKTGEAFWERIPNGFLLEQNRLRTARAGLYKSLLVSREQKKKVEQTEGKQKTDLLAALTRLREAALGADGGPPSPIARHALDTIEAQHRDLAALNEDEEPDA